MSVVSISSIAAFFDGEPKQLRRGENALCSQCLESFLFDGSSGQIIARVKASMKNRTYNVKVSGILYDRATEWWNLVHFSP